jgi:hypothetical protein
MKNIMKVYDCYERYVRIKQTPTDEEFIAGVLKALEETKPLFERYFKMGI